MSEDDPDVDTTFYQVLVNHEEQYSIWPEYKEKPPGWNDVGKTGSEAECLAYINEIWTDMRPLSLRNKMRELAENPPPIPPPGPRQPRRKSLVERLCEGDHPVEVALRPDRSIKLFKEAIDRNFVHIEFTDTRGGTELGFELDLDTCDFRSADFESAAGVVHLEGELTVDYVNARCIADVDLQTLKGKGYLRKFDTAETVETPADFLDEFRGQHFQMP